MWTRKAQKVISVRYKWRMALAFHSSILIHLINGRPGVRPSLCVFGHWRQWSLTRVRARLNCIAVVHETVNPINAETILIELLWHRPTSPVRWTPMPIGLTVKLTIRWTNCRWLCCLTGRQRPWRVDLRAGRSTQPNSHLQQRRNHRRKRSSASRVTDSDILYDITLLFRCH